MRKTVTAAAMAASLTIGGAAGAALFVPSLSGAQTDDPPAEVDETDERSGFLSDALAPLVEDGTITEDQADAVIAAIHDARPEGGFRHHRFPFGSALTEVLGIDGAALRDALADGQTIAEIAEANDVAVQDVIDALVAEAQERIDQAVADGRLTEEEADEKLDQVTERITALVNGELERADLGRRGHRFGGPADDTVGS